MADDVTLSAGTADGAVIATDDDATRHWQLVKAAFGDTTTYTRVSLTDGLPIQNDDTDLKITMDGEAVVLGAGTAEIGKLAAGVAEIGNVKNSGTFAVQIDGAALTALQLLDNTVLADDAAFTAGSDGVSMAGFVFDDTTPDSVDEGDAGAARMSANRNIYMTIRDAAGNERGLNVDASGAIAITDGGSTVSVDGTVTETNSAAILTALQILDDWDESDRAKVNLIVGQAGIAGGTGVDGATVPRVSLATDVALPAGSNTIGEVTIGAATTAAGDLAKAEDAAHSSGDIGVMALGVRNDDLAALAGADGDYAPLQVTQNGALLMCPAANDDYKYAVINAASGDNEIVALVASRKIRVLAVTLISAGTSDCRFESNAAGTALTGVMKLTAQVGFAAAFNPAGHFESAAGQSISLECTGDIDGFLTYIEVA